ncbi:hypothetical protein TARUN_1819 [Trichoderma arundinaceum]|uniref:Uncharacterized protein n=1 Tax=Trichoderma arundinaceum TaxID=490622 RepID=A0A395NWH9_TRIAR|nr:hypothetical protein TARUN_1819 [Trichoderma arundinaceum]
MVAQFSKSYTTKVWNDTADHPRHHTDPAIIICTIQQSGALVENYNKGMAAGGLFVALLGVAACAGPPAAGMVVGIGGLVLAGQSVYDNFYEDANKSRTRVLYLGDAVTRSANDRDDNEIILLRAYMTEGVDTTGAKRPMIKVTRYFLPKATAGYQYSVTDILDDKTTVVEDQFGFYFREPHVILPRLYISIRGMRPTGTAKGSEDPPEELPKPSSGLWYDPTGKFKKFYVRKERDKTTGRWGDVFDSFEHSKDVRDIVTIVEGIPTWLSSSIRITNLPDERKTPVLVMGGWTSSAVKDKIGHYQNETEVLKLIRNQRGSPFGYRWDLTNPVKDSNDVYPIDWYNKGSITKSMGSYIFFVIKDTDWTYTTTIVKKKTT